MELTPARVATFLTSVGAASVAMGPVIAGLDWSSKATGAASAFALVIALDRFLVGQRAHEARAQTGRPSLGQVSQALPTIEKVAADAEAVTQILSAQEVKP